MGEHIMPVIGLTGPTGAGKSTVAGFFKKLGCQVIDCDKIAREITSQPGCLEALKKEFGNDIVMNGILDRKKLADRAFSSRDGAQRLNAITHPIIMREVKEQIRACRETGAAAALIDAPLLFESGADALCTHTVSVTADYRLRMQRVMERDGIGEAEAQARMSAQQPDAYYRSLAASHLDGGASLPELEKEVERLYRLMANRMEA